MGAAGAEGSRAGGRAGNKDMPWAAMSTRHLTVTGTRRRQHFQGAGGILSPAGLPAIHTLVPATGSRSLAGATGCICAGHEAHRTCYAPDWPSPRLRPSRPGAISTTSSTRQRRPRSAPSPHHAQRHAQHHHGTHVDKGLGMMTFFHAALPGKPDQCHLLDQQTRTTQRLSVRDPLIQNSMGCIETSCAGVRCAVVEHPARGSLCGRGVTRNVLGPHDRFSAFL